MYKWGKPDEFILVANQFHNRTVIDYKESNSENSCCHMNNGHKNVALVYLIHFYSFLCPEAFAIFSFLDNSNVLKVIYNFRNSILLPKLLWPSVRKKMFYGSKKNSAFSFEFQNVLWSLKQFIQIMKGQNNFWNWILF